MIRAFLILNTNHSAQTAKVREEIRQVILSNILAGKFEFNQGNTLAAFAEAFLTSLDINLKDSRKVNVPFDYLNGSQ
jgi:hypothetical protein